MNDAVATYTKLSSDTSTSGMFRYGFDRAIACWRSGCTIESITHTASTGSAKDRGVIAACEMLMGWHDIAEREARAHGMTREEAARFIAGKAAKESDDHTR